MVPESVCVLTAVGTALYRRAWWLLGGASDLVTYAAPGASGRGHLFTSDWGVSRVARRAHALNNQNVRGMTLSCAARLSAMYCAGSQCWRRRPLTGQQENKKEGKWTNCPLALRPGPQQRAGLSPPPVTFSSRTRPQPRRSRSHGTVSLPSDPTTDGALPVRCAGRAAVAFLQAHSSHRQAGDEDYSTDAKGGAEVAGLMVQASARRAAAENDGGPRDQPRG